MPRLTRCLLLAAFATSALSAATPPPNYDEAKAGTLPIPDPLVCVDGTRVEDTSTWRAKRRPELLELFAREVYGRTPAGRPKDLHWKVTSVDPNALGGKATRKEITIWFTLRTDGPRMHLLIYQPNRVARPLATFLGLNYFGNQCVNADPGITLSQAWMRAAPERGIVDHRATEASRGTHASRWQIETVIARGYASATVYYGDLCPDRDDGMEESVGALFQSGTRNERPADGWGSIGIWAWGLSRALDYLESDPDIDSKRVAVHGHSRLGKTALWAGAQDERFALVISNCSGAGGAKLAKRIYGETVALSTTRHSTPWYALNYRRYANNEAALPIDQHELLALISPRPLYVASAVEDRGADPKGEFLAAKLASPVYALFGKKGVGVDALPPVDHPVGDTVGYHIRTGVHDITAYDWAQYLDFADRHLRAAK